MVYCHCSSNVRGLAVGVVYIIYALVALGLVNMCCAWGAAKCPDGGDGGGDGNDV